MVLRATSVDACMDQMSHLWQGSLTWSWCHCEDAALGCIAKQGEGRGLLCWMQ